VFRDLTAIVVFSVGEMLAGPRSKECPGGIALPAKVGMYMRYFSWCAALGNLFGDLFSGIAYQHLGPHGVDRSDLMWILFAAFAAVTEVTLVIYKQ
jgi:hypothetical protein